MAWVWLCDAVDDRHDFVAFSCLLACPEVDAPQPYVAHGAPVSACPLHVGRGATYTDTASMLDAGVAR